MRRSIVQVSGAVLLGIAIGLLARTITSPAHQLLTIYVVIVGCGIAGGYLLTGPGGNRRVVFEFIGGFMDGRVLVGDLSSQSKGKATDEAVRHYLSTDRGTIGKRFMSASDYMLDTLKKHGGDVTALRSASRDPRFQCDHYEVVERHEGRNGVVVKAKYVNV